MEILERMKREEISIKDCLIFIVLFIWMITPILKSCVIYRLFSETKYYYVIMTMAGLIGIIFAIYNIYIKIKNSNTKNKELLPIFIMGIYMIWTLISCFFSPNKELAFKGSEYRLEGYFTYINYAGFFFCGWLLDNKVLRKILLNIFVVSAIFLIIITRLHLSNINLEKIFCNNHIYSSVFRQFNHYGYFLLMASMCCLGLFITQKKIIIKVIYLEMYIIITFALIYNNTFGCYLAMLLTLIIYAIYAIIKKRDRKYAIIALVVLILMSCFTTKNKKNIVYDNLYVFFNDINIVAQKTKGDKSEAVEKEFLKVGTSRMNIWKSGMKFIIESPVIGYGPENLEKKYHQERINQDRPHNLLIQLSTTSGIPGMLLYITSVGIIVITGMWNLLKNNQEGKIYLLIVVAYLISAMFGNSMFYTSPYFFIFLGSLMKYNTHER